MKRRDFIWLLGGSAIACTVGCAPEDNAPGADAATGGHDHDDANAPTTGDAGVDGCVQQTVTMHDTYAQALYLDGSKGPLTGTVRVTQVIASAAVTMDFWHGHSGVLHRFTLEPMHFAALKQGQRVTLGTTTVEGHAHTLFVDPTDEQYRVPGAPDVEVPLGC